MLIRPQSSNLAKIRVVGIGGGALTVGLREVARRTLAMPIRIGNSTAKQSSRFSLPSGNFGFAKTIKKLLNLIKTFIP